MATLQPSQTQTIELEGAVLTMTLAAKLSDIDWKQRCDQLEFEHQLDLERIRLHYDHELKEKVAGKEQHINNVKLFFVFRNPITVET